MTVKEAIRILDPETRREALRRIPVMERMETDQEACRIAVAALRAQQAHAQLDESRWKACNYCMPKFAHYAVKPCANGDLGVRAMYVVDGSGPGVILFADRNIASGYFDILYCPFCGRPLTEEAWAELERRIGGT